MISKSRELKERIIEDGLSVLEFTKLLVEVKRPLNFVSRRHSSFSDINSYAVKAAMEGALRFQILIPSLKKYAKYFDFSMLHPVERATLLCVDWWSFSPYMSVGLLSTKLRVQIVRAHPALFTDVLDHVRISKSEFSDLIITNPIIAQMSTKVPYAHLLIDAWESLLHSDYQTYFKVLLQHLAEMRSKTYVRKILMICPGIILQLSIKNIQDSVLTEKEWLLYADNKKLKFSKQVASWIEKTIAMQILAGTCKLSRPLKEAINYAKAA